LSGALDTENLAKVQSIIQINITRALGAELVLTKASLQKITSLEQTQQIINTQLFLHNVFADKSSPEIFSHRFNAPSKPEIFLL
jgi:cysteine synthase